MITVLAAINSYFSLPVITCTALVVFESIKKTDLHLEFDLCSYFCVLNKGVVSMEEESVCLIIAGLSGPASQADRLKVSSSNLLRCDLRIYFGSAEPTLQKNSV